MSEILDQFQDSERRHYETGAVLFEQGGREGVLMFLIEGTVEVLKDDVQVAKTSEPGAVFGEMSALLDSTHTATVRTLAPSSFFIVENPRAFLEAHPRMSLHVAEILAHRLEKLTRYLVDVKQQYEGHDHLGMVDRVLETLMHRHPRRVTRQIPGAQ